MSRESPDLTDWIRVKLQDGPVREVGVNGAQIDDVIDWCRAALIGFNQPPYENIRNTLAISYLDLALDQLKLRTLEREERGVEGTSTP